MLYKRQVLTSLLISITILITGCKASVENQTSNITPKPPETTVVENTDTPTDVPTAVVDITKEPPQGLGTITGKLCFPSSHIPPLELRFFEALGGYTPLFTMENQTEYEMELPAGQYFAFAHPEGSTIRGGYTQYVNCGLEVGCTDHTPIIFDVITDQITSGVDICDWYMQTEAPGHSPDTDDPLYIVSGLVYRDFKSNSLMQYDGFSKTHNTLFGRQDGVVPIANRYLLYEFEDDVWVWDVYAQQSTNLTQTEDRLEGIPVWSRDLSVIVFSTRERLDTIGPSFGDVGVLNTETGQYSIVSNHSMAEPAISPNGEYIAYDEVGSAWVYEVDTGKTRELIFSDYGYQISKDFKVGSPVWSPDNTKVAWWVGGGNPDTGYQHSLIALDLESQSHEVVYSYTPVGGRGGWLLPAYWSPDGKYLAFMTDMEYGRPIIYYYKLETQEVFSIGGGANPIWSPDSSLIAFTYWGPQSGTVLEGQVFIWSIAEEASVDIPELIGTMPIAWFAPDANG